MALAGFADVAVEDHLAIDRYGDAVAYGADLLGVPRPLFAEDDVLLRRDDPIDRAVLLVDVQVL